MSIREKKEQEVAEIAEKLKRSKEVVLVDYRGLSVKNMADLRSQLREAGIDLKVYKNTLTKLAVKKTGHEDMSEYLEGPTAIAFDYQDEVTLPKILVNFAKEHKELELKGGALGQQGIDLDQIKSLASLPSREELIAKAVGAIAGPLRSFVYVLNAPIQSFGRVVQQIADSKN
jgi:large subunit ribosomal protein L10